MFIIYIKKFFLSPYYLYKSIQSIKTSVNTPIVEKVEKPTMTQEKYRPKEIDISDVSFTLYKESQRELATLKEHLKQNIEKHQIQIQEITASKDTELTNYKKEIKDKIDIVKEENSKLANDKHEMELKYTEITTQMETLITQHNNDALEIQKLTEKSKSLEEKLNQANAAKANVEAETLALANRLTEEQKTIEASHQLYVKKHKYMSPNESQALLQERDTLQKKVEKADKNITVIKDEMNKIYKGDVEISRKLVAYLEDLKQIEKTIASLTDNLQQISHEKTETISKIEQQKYEINLLGIIDKKSNYSQKDIEELSERIKKVKQIENIIELATIQLKTVSADENIIIAKLNDHVYYVLNVMIFLLNK
jgi:chromosome segregation ATPase